MPPPKTKQGDGEQDQDVLSRQLRPHAPVSVVKAAKYAEVTSSLLLHGTTNCSRHWQCCRAAQLFHSMQRLMLL